MKLVLLPGLDGTGKLFAPNLPLLADYDVLVLPLPQTGSQAYADLSDQVWEKLPGEDFLLVAESFSGPIAARIAQDGNPHLKGLFFVASFLSPPAPFLSRLARLLPLRAMINLPGSSLAIRLLCLGMDATDQMVALFKEAVRLVPSRVLKDRLLELGKFRSNLAQVSVPACVLQAKNDLLVRRAATKGIAEVFPALETQTLDGPHFLLQAKPNESAQRMMSFLGYLERGADTE